MNNFISLFILTLILSQTFAQGPGSASNPMTAPGAIGISLADTYYFGKIHLM